MKLRKNIRRKPKAQAKKGPAAKKATGRKKRRISLSTLIPIIFMVVGACVVAYPTFSDWWNSYHQSRAIATYVSAVEQTDPEAIDRMFEEAHAYNQRLLSKPNRYTMTEAEKKEYESILDLTGTGVIGYIQINCIGVNLPIYHGVAESVLQVAIGHIEGTSLPVGGPTTHAAVSGHRGLPSAKLFTDLDKLVEGDTFTITVLNETLTYQVDQIRIVEPQDLSDLNFFRDQDYVTLITCTPYGINTHRMLVRGHRIDNISGAIAIPAEAVQIPNYVAIPAVGIPMLFVFLIGMLVYYHVKGMPLDHDKALKAVRASEEMKRAEAAEAATQAEAEEQADVEHAIEGQTDAVSEEQGVAADETEAPTEPEADDAAEAEPEPEAEDEAAGEPEGEGEPAVEAVTDSEAEESKELETEANDSVEPEAEESVEPEAEGAPAVVTELGAESEPAVETEAEQLSEVEAETELEAAEDPDSADEPKAAEVEPDTEPVTEPEAEVEPVEEPETDAGSDAEPESESDADPDFAPEPEPEPVSQADTDNEPAAKAPQDPENDPKISMIADRSDNFDNIASSGESRDTVEAGGSSEDEISEDMRDTEVEDEE